MSEKVENGTSPFILIPHYESIISCFQSSQGDLRNFGVKVISFSTSQIALHASLSCFAQGSLANLLKVSSLLSSWARMRCQTPKLFFVNSVISGMEWQLRIPRIQK